MRVWHWVGLIFFISLVSLSEAVDKGNFKTCQQSSFCQRNRVLSDQIKLSSYQFVQNSFIFGQDLISADILNYQNGVLFTFQLRILENNKAWLRIDEKTPMKERYKVRDVIVGGTTPSKYVHSVKNDKTSIKFESNELIIQHQPFNLEFLMNGESVITVNARGLMNFEHLREKNTITNSQTETTETTETTDENGEKSEIKTEQPKNEEEGLWEETFKGHKDEKPFGPSSVGLDFTFPGSSNVYGIPEHAMGLSLAETKRGSQVVNEPFRLYNLDVFEYELDVTMALYGAIPFLFSHRPDYTVGILWLNAAETWVDIDKSSTGEIKYSSGKAYSNRVDTHWISESGVIDVFFMLANSPSQLIQQYTSLTGTSYLPPLYSIAYHQCRWNYVDEEDVAKVDSGFDEHNIPYDVIWLDIEHTDSKKYFTWNSVKFPTPQQMQLNIANKKRRMVTIVDPHIKREQGYSIHTDASSRNHYVKTRNGDSFEGWCWPGSSSWVDFTSPEAREWWSSLFSFDSYHGSTEYLSIWNDMNEPSVFNGPEVTMHKHNVHHQGWEHRDVHNIYGFYQHMATAQGLQQRDNKRPFVLSRAFFAGSQRYGAIWTGDNKADWSHLKISTPMLLSLGVSGLTFSGADVGGFFGNPEEELLVRWYQAGAFQPFFRGHAHIDTKRREPWLFGEPYTTHIRDAIQTRYTLLPLWYTLFHEANKTGAPTMRPLFYEFPKDVSTFTIDDTFLVGSRLLVKPVTTKGQTTQDIYLPGSGQKWYDFNTFQAYQGGQTISISTPLDKIPVFIQGGSVIPKKERIRRSSKVMEKDPYTLVIALNADNKASGDIYIDDGISFDYKSGCFFWRNIIFENNKIQNVNIGNSGKCKPSNVSDEVERIVLIGLSSSPSKVKVENEVISFSYDQKEKTLTLKKPLVKLGFDWTIELL